MVNIFICGDIVNQENKSGQVCSDVLADIIKKSDYSICNFEAPIEGFGEPIPKSGTHLSQRKITLTGLQKQGFNLLSMANNHIMDFGTEGLLATMKEAKRLGLDTLGVGLNFNEAYKPLIKLINNVKIGFINACEAQFGVLDYFVGNDQPGYAWINHFEIDRQIIRLRKECDFIIFLAHAGLENYDIPQKEWRNRYRHFCDLGVDVVVGSHPHVPQGYEKYNNSIIFYSLGNFYFDSKEFIKSEDQSFSVLLKLEKGKQINFELIYHFKQNGMVKLSSKTKQINVNLLNFKLGKEYQDLHDRMSIEIFNKKIKRNFMYSLLPFPYDGHIKSTLKKIVKTIIGRSKKIDKNLLLLHLLRNESYYYASRHALELIAKKDCGG